MPILAGLGSSGPPFLGGGRIAFDCGAKTYRFGSSIDEAAAMNRDGSVRGLAILEALSPKKYDENRRLQGLSSVCSCTLSDLA